MVDRNHFCLFRKQSVKPLHDQFSLFVHRDNRQLSARPFAQHLPRNNIGMMLQSRNHHLIPWFQERSKPISDQIDAMRRSRRKKHLVAMSRIDMALDFAARSLIRISRQLAQLVHTAMDVRIDFFIIRSNRL
ncbi:hypothetical protein D9M72_573230 [compost metagenome]